VCKIVVPVVFPAQTTNVLIVTDPALKVGYSAALEITVVKFV